MRTFWYWVTSLVFCACFINSRDSASVRAQSIEEEVRAMRAEMQRLRQEVETLKQELRRWTPAPGQVTPAGREPEVQEQQVTEVLPLIQAQVAEQAQTKVESNSRLPVKIFGTVVSNTFFNTGEANWLDIPNIVSPPPASLPEGSFSSTLRQSRIGAIVDGPAIGSVKASGFLAMDFFGGIPNFQTGQTMGIPRLLYAYVRLEGERTAFEAGQDQMILAPKNPISLAAMSFPNLYRSGNLYLRVPQARVERAIGAGRLGEFHLTGGILAPIGGDFTSSFTFVPPNLAGERSRRPSLQGRLAWRSKQTGTNDSGWELGLSGHSGRERYVTGSVPSWAGALDFETRLDRFGIIGEWFLGRNIDAFGGSLGQLAESTGGFVAARLAATRQLEFNAGYGTDRLIRRALFPAPLARNSSVFVNAIHQFTPELSASFEYRWLSTLPDRGAGRRNHHLNLVLAYSF